MIASAGRPLALAMLYRRFQFFGSLGHGRGQAVIRGAGVYVRPRGDEVNMGDKTRTAMMAFFKSRKDRFDVTPSGQGGEIRFEEYLNRACAPIMMMQYVQFHAGENLPSERRFH